MADKPTDAEAKLADLEKHIHAASISNFRMHRSEQDMYKYADEPEVAAKHKADFEKHTADKAAHEKAHADSGVTPQDIDIAAQAVLDERGGVLTETEVLTGDN